MKGIWSFFTDGGTDQVMVNYGTKVAYSTGADFTDLTGITARTDGSRVYGMTMNNIAYGVSYDKPSFRWNGSSAADLGVTFGSGGNMPQAQYVAFWNNFAWVASTYESATGYKYRVRWSSANDPETWAANDYVDIDKGEHGDYITGLCPMGDRLLVFKTNSTYAIFGFDSDSFQVVTVSSTVGSVPLSSPVATPYGAFFWYADQGAYLYDGTNMVWLFPKIFPAIDDGRITFASNPQLGWGNNKLYVSVDWTDPETSAVTRRTLMYDPTLGEQGAWVLTDIDAGPLHAHRPANSSSTVFGGCVANTGVLIDMVCRRHGGPHLLPLRNTMGRRQERHCEEAVGPSPGRLVGRVDTDSAVPRLQRLRQVGPDEHVQCFDYGEDVGFAVGHSQVGRR